MKALFEIIVNSEIDLKAYFQKEDDFSWQRINQRELLGVRMEGFTFMLEMMGSVFVKARVKPKKTTFIHCSLAEYDHGNNTLVIPKVSSKRKMEVFDEIGVGLGDFGEVKISDFKTKKKVDFKSGENIFLMIPKKLTILSRKTLWGLSKIFGRMTGIRRIKAQGGW